jgi:glycosyltransferase involved in cell wall biosynthesis
VLRHLDAYLVTSGKANVKIPVRNFDLSYSEYLLLLHVSDVVLTLSKFNEGWNATAHEAMLLGTPVIGSGKGGMAELLEGGGQLICRDLSALPELVEYALAHTAALSENGYGFASQFTIERFNLAWQNLVARFE